MTTVAISFQGQDATIPEISSEKNAEHWSELGAKMEVGPVGRNS
jgi:hypothetical protein